MSLRLRFEQWRERDRIIKRTDLSIADKVATLQGSIVEPFIAQPYVGDWLETGDM